MPLIEGHDLEEGVEEEGPCMGATEDRHTDPVLGGVQGRVRLEGASQDPDLSDPQVGGRPAVQGHVHVADGLNGKFGSLVLADVEAPVRG